MSGVHEAGTFCRWEHHFYVQGPSLIVGVSGYGGIQQGYYFDQNDPDLEFLQRADPYYLVQFSLTGWIALVELA